MSSRRADVVSRGAIICGVLLVQLGNVRSGYVTALFYACLFVSFAALFWRLAATPREALDEEAAADRAAMAGVAGKIIQWLPLLLMIVSIILGRGDYDDRWAVGPFQATRFQTLDALCLVTLSIMLVIEPLYVSARRRARPASRPPG